MDILKKCAKKVITYVDHLKNKQDIFIICDWAHAKLANKIVEICRHTDMGIKYKVVAGKQDSDNVFNCCRTRNREMATLVLIEPQTFNSFQINNWLDFQSGAPKVAGLSSYSFVSILPIESSLRIFGSDVSKDTIAKNHLLSLLEPNRDCEIVTEAGTKLFFTARNWLHLGNEILTSPVEQSVEGIIAVDGALFFQKIDNVIDLCIEAGKLVEIRARDKNSSDLVELYKKMTNHDFAERKNRQLAEIGFGCNTGAIISDCFMESEMVYGTCHFCFGNNICYGGENESDFHGGSVLIKDPYFRVRGEIFSECKSY